MFDPEVNQGEHGSTIAQMEKANQEGRNSAKPLNSREFCISFQACRVWQNTALRKDYLLKVPQRRLLLLCGPMSTGMRSAEGA
jgi:hypothetical protein